MSSRVIDASVAIKWVVEEEGTEAALALRGRRLLAPDLLNAECGNILWRKVRLGQFSPQEAFLAGRLLANADIEFFPARGLMETALEIAIMLDHPVYDCLYLALAEAQSVNFVTADKRLLQAASRHTRVRECAVSL